jgi:hypothetical protein
LWYLCNVEFGSGFTFVATIFDDMSAMMPL